MSIRCQVLVRNRFHADAAAGLRGLEVVVQRSRGGAADHDMFDVMIALFTGRSAAAVPLGGAKEVEEAEEPGEWSGAKLPSKGKRSAMTFASS